MKTMHQRCIIDLRCTVFLSDGGVITTVLRGESITIICNCHTQFLISQMLETSLWLYSLAQEIQNSFSVLRGKRHVVIPGRVEQFR
ncbi:hypothetical protein P3S67_023364 [Capsicum chacoense]